VRKTQTARGTKLFLTLKTVFCQLHGPHAMEKVFFPASRAECEAFEGSERKVLKWKIIEIKAPSGASASAIKEFLSVETNCNTAKFFSLPSLFPF
jgi:hypothetical protein